MHNAAAILKAIQLSNAAAASAQAVIVQLQYYASELRLSSASDNYYAYRSKTSRYR
jgi:hypothetical protein